MAGPGVLNATANAVKQKAQPQPPRLRFMRSNGQRIVSDDVIDPRFYNANFIAVTQAYCPKVETIRHPVLGEAVVGIGDQKQDGDAGHQYYFVIIDSAGRIVKMGLPCITTDSGNKIFPSAADLRPEDLLAAAKNLPPGYELAILVRFDRNVLPDIVVTDSTTFASLDARAPTTEFLQTPSLFPTFESPRHSDLEAANASGINEQKCVGCGGPGGKLDEDGIGKAKLSIFLGDAEKPVTLDGLSQSQSETVPRAEGIFQPEVMPLGFHSPEIAATSPAFIFSLPVLYRFDTQFRKDLPVFLRQPAEVVLSYVLFSVRCPERHRINPIRPTGFSSRIGDTAGQADAPVLKGQLSILETDHCPQSENELAATPKIDLLRSFPLQKTGLFRRGEADVETSPNPPSPMRPLKIRFSELQPDEPKQTLPTAKNKRKEQQPKAGPSRRKRRPRPSVSGIFETRKKQDKKEKMEKLTEQSPSSHNSLLKKKEAKRRVESPVIKTKATQKPKTDAPRGRRKRRQDAQLQSMQEMRKKKVKIPKPALGLPSSRLLQAKSKKKRQEKRAALQSQSEAVWLKRQKHRRPDAFILPKTQKVRTMPKVQTARTMPKALKARTIAAKASIAVPGHRLHMHMRTSAAGVKAKPLVPACDAKKDAKKKAVEKAAKKTAKKLAGKTAKEIAKKLAAKTAKKKLPAYFMLGLLGLLAKRKRNRRFSRGPAVAGS